MSYVQGTVVRLEAEFSDARTGVKFSPTEVVCTISRPDRSVEVRNLSDAEVFPVDGQTGLFFTEVDTSTGYGTWQYQFSSTGPAATYEQKSFSVRKRLAPAV